MTSASNLQTRFTGGEWSKSAQGQMADPLYRTAMNRCQNTLPLVEGSTTRRFGFRQSAPTRSGRAAKLLPWIISAAEAYNIELSDGYARFFQNCVPYTGADQSVTNVTLSTNVTVSCTAHGYANGDMVCFKFATAIAALKFAALTNRQFVVTRIDADTFSLKDALTGADVTTSFAAFAAATDTVTVARIVELAAPYTADQFPDVRILQSNDRTVLLHGENQPQEVALTGLTAADFVDGPYLDPVSGSVITPDALTGLINFTLSFKAYDATVAYSVGDFVSSSGTGWQSIAAANINHAPAVGSAYWTPANPGDAVRSGGFTSGDIGRHLRFFSEPLAWVSATTYAAGNVVKFNNLYWTALTSMTGATPGAGNINPNQPGNLTTTWAVNPTAAAWSWGKVNALSTTGVISQTLSGAANIGNQTGGGGLAALFDGNQFQSAGSGQAASGGASVARYAGRNYSGASAQTISSARVYPSSDFGFATGPFAAVSANVTLNLRAKSTLPANSADGTLLGTVAFFTNSASPDLSAKTITSNDNSTTWNYVWVEITSDNTSNGTALSEIEFYSGSGVAGSGVQVQLLGTPLLYVAAVNTWRLGLYNNAEPKWPTNGCYSEGRFWLSGAVVNRVDSSMSNAPFTFSPTAADGTVADNHAISYTFNFKEKNDILWMQAETTGILCGTAGAAVLVRAPTPGAMSPTNISANPVTSYGCADVEPVSQGLVTVFVNQYQRQLHEQMRDAYSGAIVSPEITDNAKHLTAGNVEQIALTKSLQPIVWARTGDGRLIATTYRRTSLISSQPPEVNAWHEHPLGGDPDLEVISISSAPSRDGMLDTLGVVTLSEDGWHHVAFGTTFPEEEDTIWQAQYLDDAIVPSCGESYTNDTGVRLHGLWSLNNRVVTAFVCGLDCGDFVVSNGYIEVPYGSAGGLFTKRFVTELSAAGEDLKDIGVVIDNGQFTIPAVVGYSFVSRGQTLRPASPADTGAQSGPGFGKSRRVNELAIMLHNSAGLYLGTDFDKMRPALFKTPGGRAYTPTELFSGVFVQPPDDDNSFDGMLAWETRRPYPTRVLAIGSKLQTQD